MMKVKYIIISSVLSITISCKIRNDAQLKHEFGTTSRVPSDYEFEPCELSYESQKKFPKTQSHLQNIAEEIMKANIQVFKPGSPLDPEKFCINVKYAGSFNAEVIPGQRHIRFNTTTVQMAENDALLAAVMSHELAHITLLHSVLPHPQFEINEQTKSEVNQLKVLVKQISQLTNEANRLRDLILTDLEAVSDENRRHQLQKDLITMFDGDGGDNNSVGDSIVRHGKVRMSSYTFQRNGFLTRLPEDLRAGVGQKMDKIVGIFIKLSPLIEEYGSINLKLTKELLKNTELGIDEGINWQEQEADEVGFEFYRRAGFKEDYYFDLMHLLATTTPGVSSEDIATCVHRAFKTLALQQMEFEPPRGFGAHPDICWRIFDQMREQVLHKDDYKTFPNDKVMINTSGLIEARTEIMNEVSKTLNSPEAIEGINFPN